MRLAKLFRHDPSCGEVMEVLQAYLDGEVDEATAREVAHHLDRCPPCYRESMVFRRIKVSLSHRRATIDPAVAQALHDYAHRVMRSEVD
jgi:anti-sigma factor (TIGR02949 family)